MEDSFVLLSKPLKRKVFEFMDKKPNANIVELYFEFKNANRDTLKVYKSQFRKLYKIKHFNIKWSYLKIILDILNFKAVVPALNKEENMALLYFDKLIMENYKGDS